MSKVIVDEIQTDTTDGNVRIIPNGSGKLEVKGAGGDDAMLQLNCSAQSHGVKLKSPAHSAGQSYTMILPDNQIAADKFLKVKSITGSGATAVGQLEYADAGDATKMPLAGGTFSAEVIFQKEITETVFAITDASSVALDPINGMIQTWTLGANRTATDSLTTGQSMLLIITASSSNYTLTWPTMKWSGGSAPTLGGANPTAIELFKVGSQLYGATVGDLS